MDRLLTDKELSSETGIPTDTLADWRYRGKGPAFVRLGRHVRYRETDVVEWITAQRVATEAA